MLTRTLVVLLVTSSIARSQLHVWVDPVHGRDTNVGTIPGQPWKTLKHALAEVQITGSSESVVHLLPGTFSVSSGEVFPLVVDQTTELHGETGSESTRIEGATGSTVLRVVPVMGAQVAAKIRGIEIVGAPAQPGGPVVPAVNAVGVALELSDVVTRGGRVGVWAGHLTANRCHLQDFDDHAVQLDSNFPGGVPSVHLVESEIRNCGAAVFYPACYATQEATITLERCEVHACNLVVSATNQYCHGISLPPRIAIRDSLLVGNGVAAFVLLFPDASARLEGVTLDGAGVGTQPMLPHNPPAQFMVNCISIGHTVSDALFHEQSCHTSFFGDGSHQGTNGNITAASPSFVNAAQGDYRLAFGSPCVDAGVESSSSLDLAGLPRQSDGDLRLGIEPDLGAFELRVLHGPASVPVGAAYSLEVQGLVGEGYQLFFSRTGLALYGNPTPFGRLFLPATASRIHVGVMTNSAPEMVWLSIPQIPALVGSEYGFQALVREPGLPFGAGWSQPLVLEIEP